MAQESLKMPPQLTDDSCYTSCKNDLDVWCLFTELDKKKMGPAVYLSLSGKLRDAVCELNPADLSKDEGLKLITDKLDAIYLKDRNTRAYLAFRIFCNYRRTSGMPMPEFVIEFEHHHHELKKFNMKQNFFKRAGLKIYSIVPSIVDQKKWSLGTVAMKKRLKQDLILKECQLKDLSTREVEHLNTRSSIPYRDPTGKGSSQEIISTREIEQSKSQLINTSSWRKRWNTAQ